MEAPLEYEVVEVPTDIRDLIPDYLRRRNEDLSELQEALANDDRTTMRTIAHRLKGSGQSFGFDRLTYFGEELERALVRGEPRLLARQIELIEYYLRTVRWQ